MSNSNQVVRAAGLLMAISVLSRLAGFIRETAIANGFGTSMYADSYVMSYAIVNVLYLILGGALATVFIPVFTSIRAKDEADIGLHTPSESSWRFASTVFNLTVLVMGIFSLLGMLFSGELVAVIAPKFSPEAAALTAELTRIMFPIVLLAAVSMLLGGVLNSLQHFALPALSSVVFSLTVTVAALAMGGSKEVGIRVVAVSTVIAILLMVAVQVPALRGRRLRYFPSLSLKQEGIKQLGILMGPVVLNNAVQQFYILVEKFLASGLVVGSISALNYANKLLFLPFNLFAMSINIAIFPSLAEHAARNDREALGRTTAMGLKLIGLLTIPATVGMLALAGPVVRLVYQRGEFNALSTLMTTRALYFYLLGLFALGGYNVLNRAFYSLQDTRTPLVIGVCSVLANTLFAWLLVGPMQHAGLALAVALAANFNLVLSYLYLRRRLPGLSLRELAPPLGRMLLVSLVMGLGTWLTYQGLGLAFWPGQTGEHIPLLRQVIQLGLAVAVGLVLYIWGIEWTKADEETTTLVRQFAASIVKRLRPGQK
ncbi:MAG: murein biosynthesis integral membrane protein MurJ [Firmicutes bacterium]|nr:murein biosynthesis integral membrane protein MurJ [Bacillota bacterium]